MATGRTKDLPGFDRLTRFVALQETYPHGSGGAGRAVVRSSGVRTGLSRTDEDAEEAHHVPGDALFEQWRLAN